jgi:hypothetical protein
MTYIYRIQIEAPGFDNEERVVDKFGNFLTPLVRQNFVEYYPYDTINVVTISPSNVETFEASIQKKCARVRYDKIIEGLSYENTVVDVRSVESSEAPTASLNSYDSEDYFTVTVQLQNEAFTRDETNNNDPIYGNNAVRRIVARVLGQTHQVGNVLLHDPVSGNLVTHNLVVKRITDPVNTLALVSVSRLS